MRRIMLFSLIILFVQTNSDLIRSEVPASAEAKIKSSDAENIEIEYTFSEPEIEKIDEGYYSIEMEDTHKYWDEPGLPLLPFKTVKVLIPQDRDVKNINIVPGRKIILDGEFKIEYSKQQIPISRPDLMVEIEPNQDVYNSRNPFPGRLYSEVSTQYQRGSKILILNLYPVQYVPVLGEVSYYPKMKVIVTTIPTE